MSPDGPCHDSRSPGTRHETRAAVAGREGAELFSQSLRTKGVPTELVVYAGAHHGGWPTEVERDYRERVRAWFDKYLK